MGSQEASLKTLQESTPAKMHPARCLGSTQKGPETKFQAEGRHLDSPGVKEIMRTNSQANDSEALLLVGVEKKVAEKK